MRSGFGTVSASATWLRLPHRFALLETASDGVSRIDVGSRWTGDSGPYHLLLTPVRPPIPLPGVSPHVRFARLTWIQTSFASHGYNVSAASKRTTFAPRSLPVQLRRRGIVY